MRRAVAWHTYKRIMSIYGEHPPMRFAAESGDPVWQWFIYNGPHGARFTWHNEYGSRGLDVLGEFINKLAEDDPDFRMKAQQVARQALQSENVVMQRKAIQVLTIVGTEEDMESVQQALNSANSDVVKDARCCLFERGFKSHGRHR